MDSPQYRELLQQFTNLVVAEVPTSWSSATVYATFPAKGAVDLELRYRTEDVAKDHSMDISDDFIWDFVDAAKAIRAELAQAGNPECSALLFTITRAGKCSVDVEY